jgi:ribonuclease E
MQEPETDITIVEAPVETVQPPAETSAERDAGSLDSRGRKRRRRRRGGRGRGPPSPVQEIGIDGRPSEIQSAPPPSGETQLGPLPIDTDEDEERQSETGAEGHSEQKESHAGLAPAQAGENGGKRRRRRRGRRGRRREGEMVGGESAAHEQSQAEPASFIAPTPAEEEHPVVMPNAPSSPLWSLTDQAPVQRPSLPERAAQEIYEEPRMPVSAAAETQSRTEVQDTREPERPEGVDATPHEARKGWWQRRFKS